MAAHMEWLRHNPPKLSLPEELTKESYELWRAKVKEKVKDLLLMPEFTEQPDPIRLDCVQRDGYRVEKWEFYPDDFSAVPFLMLIPDGVTKDNPAPGVVCLPGSTCSKEFLAGEPLLEAKSCQFSKFPERNRIALYAVQNGMVAFAFDNLETCEAGLLCDTDYATRSQFCHGLMQSGLCYFGLSVFQKLCFMKFMKKLDFVDQSRLGLAAHSLGTNDATYLALLCDEFKALVFNDYLSDEWRNYITKTEAESELAMRNNAGNWHEVPGIIRWFSHADLVSALAPKYLALNEGGSDCNLDKPRRAYEVNGVSDRLLISYYPAYADPASRPQMEKYPLYGFDMDTHFAFNRVIVGDHSFRQEPSMRLLKMAFGME